jgi:hypothetical protein
VRARFPFVETILALWIALWVLMGYVVSTQVHGIAKLGDTVALAGESLQQTADGLDALHGVPFVGGDVHRFAVSARRTAASAVANGRRTRSDVDRLALLLWTAIAAGPSLPAIAAYGWLRRRRRP